MKTKKDHLIVYITVAVFAALLIIAGVFYYMSQRPSTEEKVEGLDKFGKIKVITREVGSGTRTEFYSILGFNLGDKSPKDALTAGGTYEVLELAGMDRSAVGYCSAGVVESNKNYKVLKVNGSSPFGENGKYPVGRPFTLAWIGKLTDLEQDFLTYIKGKGQKIVEQSYSSVSGSSSFLSTKPKGKLLITGSSSMAPLLKELATEYMSINKKANICVVSSDTNTGIDDVLKSHSDMAMCSREFEDYEKELLSYETIARDEIAIIVNKENPLEDISLEQLKRIYGGEITEWRKLYE